MKQRTQIGRKKEVQAGKNTELKGLENNPRFLKRIEQARKSLRAGQGRRLEDVTE